jgi:hypothetical protein
MRTSPVPGTEVGRSTSSSTDGSPACVYVIARIACQALLRLFSVIISLRALSCLFTGAL